MSFAVPESPAPSVHVPTTGGPVGTTLFVMTVYADVVALAGASLAAYGLLGVTPLSFFNGLTGGLLGTSDVLSGLVKAVVFGVMIAVSSCYFGLSTKGGAPGVGRSVNATVVASTSAPEAALHRSSCCRGGWSIESLPERAVLRSSAPNCLISRV